MTHLAQLPTCPAPGWPDRGKEGQVSPWEEPRGRGKPKEGPQEADPRSKRGSFQPSPGDGALWTVCGLPPQAQSMMNPPACPPWLWTRTPVLPALLRLLPAHLLPRPAPPPSLGPCTRITHTLPPTASSPSSPRLSLHLCPSGQLCPPQPGAHPSPARRGPPWLHLHPLSCPAPRSSSSPHSPPPAAPPFWPLPHNTSQSEAIKLCTLIAPTEWAVGTPEPPTLHPNYPTLVQPTSDPIPVMVSTSEARQDLAEAAGPVKFGL